MGNEFKSVKCPSPSLAIIGSAKLGDGRLFDPLELNVLKGGWTCLLGSSGVGKTTILRFIAGLETAAKFSGEITTSDGISLKGRLSYMAQSDLLLPWATVIENVTLGGKLRNQEVDQRRALSVIERVGLSQHCYKKPARLSGGQRQRVALARTFLEDKPVVLLDEPFSSLDARTRSEMQELASELFIDRTILLITHDPAEAARLGKAIYILSSSGLTKVDNLSPPFPRSVDDKELLQLQGDLLNILRQAT